MENNESNIIIYNTIDGKAVWMNQNQLAELFDTSVPNVCMHIANVLKEGELQRNSVIKNYLTTAADGKNYEVTFYSLEMIMAIGFRVRSKRGTQFRIWANQHLTEYLVKGFTMDDERLKNPNGRPDYFDELLERIREIRASEKRFYQKVRDLLALSSDYDKTDKATQMFFAETQNKLLYAVTGQTAAEIIVGTSWQGSIVRKGDIYTAKNYLRQEEIDVLNRLTTMFLDSAELRVRERKDLTLRYWRETVDSLLNFQGKVVLQGAGSISNKQMEAHVDAVYEAFNARRKALAAAEADEEDRELFAVTDGSADVSDVSGEADAELAALEEAVEKREK